MKLYNVYSYVETDHPSCDIETVVLAEDEEQAKKLFKKHYSNRDITNCAEIISDFTKPLIVEL